MNVNVFAFEGVEDWEWAFSLLFVTEGFLGNRQAVTTSPRQGILFDDQGASENTSTWKRVRTSGFVISAVFKLGTRHDTP